MRSHAVVALLDIVDSLPLANAAIACIQTQHSLLFPPCSQECAPNSNRHRFLVMYLFQTPVGIILESLSLVTFW